MISWISCPSRCAFLTAAGANLRNIECTLEGLAAVCSWRTNSACVFRPNNFARSALSLTVLSRTSFVSFSFLRSPLRREFIMTFSRSARFFKELSSGCPVKFIAVINHWSFKPRDSAAALQAAIWFSVNPSRSLTFSTATARSLVSASNFLPNWVCSDESSSFICFTRSRLASLNSAPAWAKSRKYRSTNQACSSLRSLAFSRRLLMRPKSSGLSRIASEWAANLGAISASIVSIWSLVSLDDLL